MRSLKKTSYQAFTGVAILLCLVIILGVRQYQLSSRYNSLITQSEELIFQFSTIREQITTALIAQDWDEIITASEPLKNLHSAIARLQENSLIPGEYRLDLAKAVDLTDLALASKKIPLSDNRVAQGLIVQEKLRGIAEYFLQFDRIIVSLMRAKVVGFQTLMIGALGITISIISLLLILLYKKALIPLLELKKQTSLPDITSRGFLYHSGTCTEISIFVDSVNKLLHQVAADPGAEPALPHLTERMEAVLNESNNLSNGIINYAQLLKDSYREVEMGTEETKILQNIIDTAEKIALLNQEI